MFRSKSSVCPACFFMSSTLRRDILQAAQTATKALDHCVSIPGFEDGLVCAAATFF